jgi:glycosyltransferase involved in cell wall biosynthesis
MTSEVDHIVAVCDWVQELLLLNDIPACKVSLSRQGIRWTPDPTPVPALAKNGKAPDEMRIAFVGRLDSTKGLHVVLEALRMAPSLKARLDVYGVVQNLANAAYQNEMLRQASRDPRISFCGPMAPAEVVPRLRQYDFLVVPSQWIETGPMVVLEAFAAGVPVIGWKLGGITEIVRDGIDGLLIEPGSFVRWTETLQRVAQDAKLRAQLKAGVRPPRTSIAVAREMLALYESFL